MFTGVTNLAIQDMEVSFFHAYIDGVDFVFIESPIFRHRGNDIYGGNRLVKTLFCFLTMLSFGMHLAI